MFVVQFLLIALACANWHRCQVQADIPKRINLFDRFVSEYDISYDPAEIKVRENNFRKSVQFIEEYNSRNENVLLQVNHLADLSEQEYSQWLGKNDVSTYWNRLTNVSDVLEASGVTNVDNLSQHVDWRVSGKVTSIKAQGKCGACWAFATVATVESAYLIKENKSLDLSEQELVDCASNQKYYNQGCAMGFSDQAFDYIRDNGLVEEAFYPYHAKDQTCDNATLRSHTKFGIHSYQIVPFNSSDLVIMQAIHDHGPVSAGINAGSNIFRFYSKGIIRDVMTGMIIPNHVVAIVGYNTINDTDVWIVRNSWGTRWGDHGYGYVERHHNLMGINNYVVYPVLK